MSKLINLFISILIFAFTSVSAYKVVQKTVTGTGTIWVYNTHDGKRCFSYTSPSVGQDIVCKRFKNFSHIEQEYVQMNLASLLMFPSTSDIEKVFIAGLGTGSLVGGIQTLCPEAQIDVSEKEPEVIKMAEKWFEHKSGPNTKVRVGDAYDFIKSESAVDYDLIILDALLGDFSAPSWQELKQTFKILKLSLKKDSGIILFNLAETRNVHQFSKILANIRKEFGRYYMMNLYKSKIIIASENGRLPYLEAIQAAARAINFKQIGVNPDKIIEKMVA